MWILFVSLFVALHILGYSNVFSAEKESLFYFSNIVRGVKYPLRCSSQQCVFSHCTIVTVIYRAFYSIYHFLGAEKYVHCASQWKDEDGCHGFLSIMRYNAIQYFIVHVEKLLFNSMLCTCVDASAEHRPTKKQRLYQSKAIHSHCPQYSVLQMIHCTQHIMYIHNINTYMQLCLIVWQREREMGWQWRTRYVRFYCYPRAGRWIYHKTQFLITKMWE